uniref:Riboflavin transporter n=1 Tax=Cuerna arida TaxID=1464854 RepID=A0A1B6H220_9HEMI
MSTVSNNAKDTPTPGISESSSLLGETLASPSEPEMKINKCWDSSRRLQVDVLAGLFGISAWLSINAMFTQLPILVQTAPEGWNLPSYLSILIQVGNFGAILYTLSEKYFPRLVAETKLIYFMLLLGSLSLILMAFYYNYTLVVFGQLHSIILFILTFCIALVGCTSSVLFIPFMNHYPEVYLISYMVGEGLSGFVPSIISLIQGVGGNPSCVNATTSTGEIILVPHTSPPLFSPTVFFSLIFSIMVVSAISFFLLNNLPSCKSQKVRKPPNRINSASVPESPTLNLYSEPDVFVTSKENRTSISPYIFLIMITVLSLFANGALPSIQSYSCLPYGNVAYHFAVNLGSMANPVACFLAYFVPQPSPKWIFSLFFISGLATCYIFTTAFLSPHPPLQGSLLGIVTIVFIWVSSSGLLSYVKMWIATFFRREGGRGLHWYGAMTQFGAAIGSAIMFYLINHLNLFTSYDPCR